MSIITLTDLAFAAGIALVVGIIAGMVLMHFTEKAVMRS
jgi:uncharacterized membrane-anchored protein YhcB (DUF1043 family)